ncbi:MAG: hypothetical protein KDA72_01465, partial [Planctomycetales bacterium]|nr:hypothetical protein [Planctomycetales bacterium]
SLVGGGCSPSQSYFSPGISTTPGAYGSLSDRGANNQQGSPNVLNAPSAMGTPATQGNVGSGVGSGSSAGTGSGASSGGGFGNISLTSGSSPGSSFAAMAPGTYIDNAIIANMFRYRFDAAYNNPLPDRAEFFYGQCGCFGGNAPGPLQPERSVDYQEFTPYLERAISPGLSLFAEAPVRFINPDINDNTGGMGDLNFGFKGSLYHTDSQFLTAQLRVYAPTGDADRGLGTGHASLEPGVLYLGRVNDRLVTQGEFRVWIPLSDSQVAGRGNFAGTILRAGLGGGYDLLNLDTHSQRRRLTGTFETVAWYITDGLAFGGIDNPVVLDADNDTIVNLKTGLRYSAGRQSIASSYGFAVTGDRWYSDIMRLEYRYAY